MGDAGDAHGNRLAAVGLASQVEIAFTEMRHNMEDLPELLELAERLGLWRCALRQAVLACPAEPSGDAPPARTCATCS